MPHDVLLLTILIAPVVLLMFFRVNAVLVFLSLCLGEVLVRYVAGNANSLLTFVAPNVPPNILNVLQVAVLLAPVVLTSMFMIGTVHGKGKLVLNILPAVGVGLLGVLLAVPLLPPGQRFGIESQDLWAQLTKLQALIVGASAFVGLVFLWAQRHRLGAKERD
ncbi:MAG TPA: hypothetical protein VLG16_02995 [Candidatus Saccharimonadales bacterium]|nr:hypothetical protein [Candidatus Saccharimonadales bacterium]